MCARPAHAPRVAPRQSLVLTNNQIGDAGAAAIASAVASGKVPQLRSLYLGGNPISAESKAAVEKAVKEALPDCYVGI